MMKVINGSTKTIQSLLRSKKTIKVLQRKECMQVLKHLLKFNRERRETTKRFQNFLKEIILNFIRISDQLKDKLLILSLATCEETSLTQQQNSSHKNKLRSLQFKHHQARTLNESQEVLEEQQPQVKFMLSNLLMKSLKRESIRSK